MTSGSFVVAGLDNGGTCNSATLLDSSRRYLVGELVETPSLVREGPEVAIAALVDALDQVLEMTGVTRAQVRAVGLGTPGPASANGVISSKGATNFLHPDWHGYDVRGALESHTGAAGRLQQRRPGAAFPLSPASHALRPAGGAALVCGGDRRHRPRWWGGRVGRRRPGASGMAGELGHVQIPVDGLLADGQPLELQLPARSPTQRSIASLTGIREEPASLLARALSRPRARPRRFDPPGVEARPPLRGARRPPRARDLRPAGDGHQAALYHRRQLRHRPRRLFRRRRRGRGFAAGSATGSSGGCGRARRFAPSSYRRRRSR